MMEQHIVVELKNNQKDFYDHLKMLINHKGKVKSETLKTDRKYVVERRGETVLRDIENEFKKLGLDFSYDDYIKKNFLISVGLRAASLLLIRKICEFTDEDIVEMGSLAPKASIFTRIILKRLSNIELLIKEIPRHWTRFYTVGKMVPFEYSGEKRFFILQLKDFDVHPILCDFYRGYCKGIMNLTGYTVKDVVEHKCVHRGDAYHEFFITW